jgi:two-component system chemotaxis response regulator CheB
MPIRVLVVDDSRFYRSRIEEMLRVDPEIEVVGSAANGHEAVEMAHRLKPDALTMDYEMPGMDGIEAIEKILRERDVPILMLSAMSFAGANTTLKALDAGAADFLPKAADGESLAQGATVLVEKIKAICAGWPNRSIGDRGSSASSAALKTAAMPMARAAETQTLRETTASKRAATPTPANPVAGNRGFRSNTRLNRNLRVVVIGASTGGPVAVQRILDHLPADFPIPLVTVVHMPASFTQAFAERLDQISALKVRLACQDTELLPGFAYVAPGGMQTVFERRNGLINVVPGDPGSPYKPSVDISFTSAADVFGGGVLGIVLTGMGADGREGALALQRAGSSVWVQNAESCVVYGMPQAVMAAQAANAELAIGQFADRLVEEVKRGRS